MSISSFVRLIERPRVDPAAEIEPVQSPSEEVSGCRVERLAFSSEAGERVTGLMVQVEASRSPRPAVITLHGTGGSKEALLPLLTDLARRGFLAVAIDGRFHGERKQQPGEGADEYVQAILTKFETGRGFPFLFDTVWDVMRLIDVLAARPEVDARRIGLMGISKGGMETYLAAAADPRVAAAVPIIAAQSYEYGLANDAWQSRVETFQAAVDGAARNAGVAALSPSFVRSFYDRVAPGIYGELDGPAVLPRIAPRPLLLINGELDPRTPGLAACVESTGRAYRALGYPDRFVVHVQRGIGHELGEAAREVALDFLVAHLGEPPQTPDSPA